MSKNLEAIKMIGEEVKMPNLLDRIRRIGKKRTKTLDAAGIASKQAVMKTEDGKEYPAKCYAYVPDAENVSTWKLRMCAVGTTEITREQLGAAAAAFSPGGFRGNKVELPSEDVAKVKAKIRSEYSKLDVKEEDMPDGIKSLMEVKNMDELVAQLKTATKSMHEDMREKMGAVFDEMEKAETDKVALVRQLAEIVAQIQDEETRTSLEEIVKAMLAAFETESENENVEEVAEEMVEEEVVEEEAKAVEINDELVGKLVDKLQLKELSTVIENQNVGLETLTKAVDEVVKKLKAITDKVTALETNDETVKEKVAELEKEDAVKLAEKQAHFIPFWASGYQASKAASTVLNEDEAKNYSEPAVPAAVAVVNAMVNRATGGK